MQDAPPEPLCQSDVLDPVRATALNVTLGRSGTIASGDELPPFFHQVYFWDPKPAPVLGRDGHPRVGGLIPDMGLPRRMWAGGRLVFHAPLKAGIRAEKHSHCEAAATKTGRSGPLALVTMRHELHQSGQHCLTEWQDLVYRADPNPDQSASEPPLAPGDEETMRALAFSTTTLFRYSALTFNGHRIHYDLPYAQQTEGYAGLVVHGPLLAQHLMLVAEEELGRLAAFSFRATAPLMDFESAQLCRREERLWVRGPGGRQCMTATAEPVSE